MRPSLRPGRLLVLIALALLIPACGGKLSTEDPLAPVPTAVDPEDIAPPALRVQWTARPPVIAGEDDEEDQDLGATQAPTLDALYAYAVHGNLLRALSIQDGTPRWELRFATPIELPAAPIAGGVAVVTAERWTWIEAGGRVRAILPIDRIPRDAIVVPEGLVQVDEIGARLVSGWELEEGPSSRWELALEGALAISVAPGDRDLYIVDSGGTVTAVDASSGRVLWANPEVTANPARVVADDRYVYVAGTDDRVRALRRHNGRRAWIGKRTGVRVIGAPAVADEVLWVAGFDAAVHGFDANSGSHLFRVPIAGRSYLDLVSWGRWIIASPIYGPWALVHAPLQYISPSDRGIPRQMSISSDGDLELRPGVGPAGVLLTDASGALRLITPPPEPLPAEEPTESSETAQRE